MQTIREGRLATHGLVNMISYSTKDHLPRDITNSEWGPSTSTINEEYEL